MTRTLHVMFCICMLALWPVHCGFFAMRGWEAHAQTTTPPDQVYSDPKVVHPPVPIRTAEAEMPEQARRQQLEGFCIVVLVVDTQGLPQNARVVRCTDPIFAKNSLNAVENYRFQPATSLQDNKPVPFRTRIEISYRFGGNRHMIPAPRPRIKLNFLLPPQPAPEEPDNAGIYILSHAFDPPNSLPKLQRWVGVGYRRAAFALDDGAGCDVALTIHEDGLASDAKITKCDDPSLEQPVLRSLLQSQFAPAILNGKPVPVRASVRLVCEGFDPLSEP